VTAQAEIWDEGQSLVRRFQRDLRVPFLDAAAKLRRAVIEMSKRAMEPDFDVFAEVEALPWSEAFTEPMDKAWRNAARPVLKASANDAVRELGFRAIKQQDPLPSLGPGAASQEDFFALQYMDRFSLTFATALTETTKNAARDILTGAIAQNLTIPQVVRQLRDTIGLTPRQAGALEKRRQRLLTLGRTPQKVERDIARTRNRMLRERAATVARTEIIASRNQGTLNGWQVAQAAGELGPQAKKVWIASNPCEICEAIVKEGPVDLNEPFISPKQGNRPLMSPPAHPRCLPGSALVSSRHRITATSERAYEGDLVVIRTSAGDRLAVTPNHPVLTPTGWKPAGTVQVGDDVVGGRFGDASGASGVDDDQQDAPSTIEEVARSFGVSPSSSTVEVPTASEDFHGDGMDGQIAVVRADRLLADGLKVPLLEQAEQALLMVRDAGEVSLACLGELLQGLQRGFSTTGSGVSGANQALPFCGWCGRHPVGHGRRAVTRLDLGLQESTSDDAATHADPFSDPLLALAREVATDKVVSVDVQSFHGQVFNLETVGGWYVSDGIVTHNCRCSMGVVSPRDGLVT